ncbi:MAG: MFS transporter [Actinomycetota bacterium]
MPPRSRRLARRTAWWALLADLIPLYAVYALLFAENGLSDAQISALFAIWCVVGIVAEIPTGAVADRYSRRLSIAVASLLQAAGYACWLAFPTFAGFAAGFILWGTGGTFVSGAFEALLYDGLAADGVAHHYATVYGRLTAIGLVGQVAAAGAASVLFARGGYLLVGQASIAVCLAAAYAGWRLPEPSRYPGPHPAGIDDDLPAEPAKYLSLLRTGVTDAARSRAVRTAIVAVALLTSLDGFEEYVPLLAHDWGLRTAAIPLATVGIPLVAAIGAAYGGAADRLRPAALGFLLGAGGAALAAAAIFAGLAGLVAVTAYYAAYRIVLVVAGARLQHRIESSARATVTSVAGVGTDLAGVLLYGAWALGQLPFFAGLVVTLAVVLPRWLRDTAN